MEKHFAIFSDDKPQLNDFVYNATAGTVDRVTDFDTVTRYSLTKQCTVEAARNYGHKVIDINEFLKTLEVMGTMKHSKYSDSIILKEIEEGDYKFVKEAFQRAADELGVRLTQIQARYYGLRNDGIKYKDVADWNEEDKAQFDPGDPEKIQRRYSEGLNRSKSPEGYGKPWQSFQKSQSGAEPAYQGDRGDEQPEKTAWKDEQDNLVIPQPPKKDFLSSESDTIITLNRPMKTILVTYSNQKTPLTEKQIRGNKLYAFNTPSEMKKGDIIESDSYSTPMIVVDVLEKPSVYYNRSTGELSDVFTSTEQRKLATLIIREDDSNTVYGKFVPKKD